MILTPRSLKKYSIFGICTQTDFDFNNNMIIDNRDHEIVFECTYNSPFPNLISEAKCIYESQVRRQTGKNVLYLYSSKNVYILYFTDIACFYLFPNNIICQILNDTPRKVIESHLLSTVFSFLLEKRKKPTLHASAFVQNGETIAFLSNSGAGKSTLASIFVSTGCELLSDDILAVDIQNRSILGQPGYPTIRMWPAEVEYFIGEYRSLPLVSQHSSKRIVPVGKHGFGTFCKYQSPLVCIYLPERFDPIEWGTGVEILPVPQHEAVINLIRYSFSPRLSDAIGARASRFHMLTYLAKKVPMRRLRYPNGLAYLPSVREAIYEDLAKITIT